LLVHADPRQLFPGENQRSFDEGEDTLIKPSSTSQSFFFFFFDLHSAASAKDIHPSNSRQAWHAEDIFLISPSRLAEVDHDRFVLESARREGEIGDA
jgi:hypothetical protein